MAKSSMRLRGAEHDRTDARRDIERHVRRSAGAGRHRALAEARRQRVCRQRTSGSRSRIRARVGPGSAVRNRGCRGARLCGPGRRRRASDRGARHRRQCAGRHAAGRALSRADHQLGRNGARTRRIHVSTPGRFARGRIAGARTPSFVAGCEARGGSARQVAHRPQASAILPGRSRYPGLARCSDRATGAADAECASGSRRTARGAA